MAHEVNAFWAAHVVHHSSEEYVCNFAKKGKRRGGGAKRVVREK
jgi:hypothetical protein